MSYRVCTACWVPHFENCKTCFGFGVYGSGVPIPVTGTEAHDRRWMIGQRPCPECGSTVDGAPREALPCGDCFHPEVEHWIAAAGPHTGFRGQCRHLGCGCARYVELRVVEVPDA